MQHALEGQSGAEPRLLHRLLVLKTGPDCRSEQDDGDDAHAPGELLAGEKSHRGDQKERSQGAGEEEKRNEDSDGLEKEIRRDIPGPREGNEQGGENEDEAPAGKHRGFEAFPKKDRAVRNGQGQEPTGIPVSKKRDVPCHRDRKDQHEQEAEKHHVDEAIAEQRSGSGEPSDIFEAFSKEPVGDDGVGREEEGDRDRHQSRVLRGDGGFHSQHAQVVAKKDQPLREGRHEWEREGGGMIFPLESSIYL